MVWDGIKTICVDFDGVLHMYASGFKSAEIIEDEPVPGAFETLADYVKRFHIVIYSARSATEEGIEAMKAWFKKWGLPAEVFDKLKFASEKPMASVYIDDRALTFRGVFPSPQELQDFKPWNKP